MIKQTVNALKLTFLGTILASCGTASSIIVTDVTIRADPIGGGWLLNAKTAKKLNKNQEFIYTAILCPINKEDAGIFSFEKLPKLRIDGSINEKPHPDSLNSEFSIALVRSENGDTNYEYLSAQEVNKILSTPTKLECKIGATRFTGGALYSN